MDGGYIITQQLNEYLREAPRNDCAMLLVTKLTGVYFVRPNIIIPHDDADVMSICYLYDSVSQIRREWHRVAEISPEWKKFYDAFDSFHDLYVITQSEELEEDEGHLMPSVTQQAIHFKIKRLYLT